MSLEARKWLHRKLNRFNEDRLVGPLAGSYYEYDKAIVSNTDPRGYVTWVDAASVKADFGQICDWIADFAAMEERG